MKRFSRSFWAIVTVAAVVCIVAVIQSRRIARPLENQTFVPREERITPEITLLQEYVRIDTSNPPGRELEGARFLVAELARRGIKAELIESAPGRANVYARIRGREPGGGLLLLSHIDVVPAAPKGWSVPPFAAKTQMNMLYGRGVLDMKSIGIAQLLAFAEVAASGKVPAHDIVFLATADEEEGGKLGIVWLLENRPEIFSGIGLALNEGGISESVQEKPTYFGVEVASKQVVVVKLHMTNRRALERVRIALEPRQRPRDPDRVLAEVPGILRNTSQYRTSNREQLADVEATIAKGDFFRLQEAYRALFCNSLALSGIQATASGGFELTVTLVNLPDERPEDSVRRIRELVAPFGAELSIVSTQGPSPITPIDTPLYRVIGEELSKKYGNEIFVGPLILPYSSNDSRFLRATGIAAYGFCPYPTTLFHTWGIHRADERLRLDWYVDGVNVMRSVVARFAEGH